MTIVRKITPEYLTIITRSLNSMTPSHAVQFVLDLIMMSDDEFLRNEQELSLFFQSLVIKNFNEKKISQDDLKDTVRNLYELLKEYQIFSFKVLLINQFKIALSNGFHPPPGMFMNTVLTLKHHQYSEEIDEIRQSGSSGKSEQTPKPLSNALIIFEALLESDSQKIKKPTYEVMGY